MVEVVSVERQGGKAVKVELRIGDIKIGFLRAKTGFIEWYRIRDGIQILDVESLFISKADYKKLMQVVRAIFAEDRKKPPSPQLPLF